MLRFVRIQLFLSAIFILSVPSQAQTQQSRNRLLTGSISGRVTIGGKPAAHAMVMIKEFRSDSDDELKVLQGGIVEQLIFMKSRTDSDGRYQFRGLAEGHYRVRAMSRAYVSKGTRNDNDGGTKIT